MSISTDAAHALVGGRPFRSCNTTVERWGDGSYAMKLHGSVIARHTPGSASIMVRLAGYNTPTTRRRLSALPGVTCTQVAGTPHLNGAAWCAWTEAQVQI